MPTNQIKHAGLKFHITKTRWQFPLLQINSILLKCSVAQSIPTNYLHITRILGCKIWDISTSIRSKLRKCLNIIMVMKIVDTCAWTVVTFSTAVNKLNILMILQKHLHYILQTFCTNCLIPIKLNFQQF